MLGRDGGWLVQLRDDDERIVAPGTWGLFGGHLEPGETPEEGLRRELREEISLVTPLLPLWFSYSTSQRIVHVFRGPLTVPLDKLKLLEGQDMALASVEMLCTGSLWSTRRGEARGFAETLKHATNVLRRTPKPMALQHSIAGERSA